MHASVHVHVHTHPHPLTHTHAQAYTCMHASVRLQKGGGRSQQLKGQYHNPSTFRLYYIPHWPKRRRCNAADILVGPSAPSPFCPSWLISRMCATCRSQGAFLQRPCSLHTTVHVAATTHAPAMKTSKQKVRCDMCMCVCVYVCMYCVCCTSWKFVCCTWWKIVSLCKPRCCWPLTPLQQRLEIRRLENKRLETGSLKTEGLKTLIRPNVILVRVCLCKCRSTTNRCETACTCTYNAKQVTLRVPKMLSKILDTPFSRLNLLPPLQLNDKA